MNTTESPAAVEMAASPELKTLPIVPGVIAIDPSDPEVLWILGRMCFICGPIAHVFQRAGYPIPKHAEEEQAHVLLWMLARYKEHGEIWRTKCEEELRALGLIHPQAKPHDEGASA